MGWGKSSELAPNKWTRWYIFPWFYRILMAFWGSKHVILSTTYDRQPRRSNFDCTHRQHQSFYITETGLIRFLTSFQYVLESELGALMGHAIKCLWILIHPMQELDHESLSVTQCYILYRNTFRFLEKEGNKSRMYDSFLCSQFHKAHSVRSELLVGNLNRMTPLRYSIISP